MPQSIEYSLEEIARLFGVINRAQENIINLQNQILDAMFPPEEIEKPPEVISPFVEIPDAAHGPEKPPEEIKHPP